MDTPKQPEPVNLAQFAWDYIVATYPQVAREARLAAENYALKQAIGHDPFAPSANEGPPVDMGDTTPVETPQLQAVDG